MLNAEHPPSLIRQYSNLLRQMRNILVLLAHAEHLTQLHRWADRKRLVGPRQAYWDKLQKIDGLLYWERRRHRGLVILCEFLYTAYRQICPSSWDLARYAKQRVRQAKRQARQAKQRARSSRRR